ncbi:MAG: hypothetical protein ACREN8_08795, partial [Candidatus Dormibacteraceae bacterium]
AFGLTSLLNMPDPALPGDAVSTVPVSLERRALHKAALACADLLEQGSLGAAQTAGADLPKPIAAYVRRRLRGLHGGETTI